MSNTSVIIKVLKALGHEVDQRIVDVDEPLKDKYDIALVGIAVPQSLSSRFVYGALWAAEEFGPERTRFYVDDWLLGQLQGQLESALRNPEKRFYSLDNRHCYELARKKTDTWIKWFKFLSKAKYEVLIPAFKWAKPRILLPRLDNIKPVIFDPTPLALIDPEVLCGSPGKIDFEPLPPDVRERKWTIAAMRDIQDWYKKQVFSWPVEVMGNKRQGQNIISERELLDLYCTRWGVVGAPYPLVTAGGGWRARFIHAAVTRSILYLDADEGRTAGPPYNLYRTQVEKASNDELLDIAMKQRDWLINQTMTMDELHESLNNYVRGT